MTRTSNCILPKQITFIKIFILIFHSLSCQQTWTLQKCIDYALQNNIQVKQEKLKTLKDDNTLQQAKFDLLPDLNAGLIHEYRTGYSLNDIDYFYDKDPKNIGYLGLESNLTLFSGFNKYNNIKLQEYELEKSLARYHQFRNNIILAVASAYLQILLDKELVDIAVKQLETSHIQYEKIDKQVKVGNFAQGELLKIKALEATDKLNVVESRNKLKLSYLNLVQLLELDSSENFKIFIPEINDILKLNIQGIESIYGQSLVNLPEIKASEINVKSKEQSLKISQGQALPVINFKTSINSWYLKTPNYDSIGVFNQIGDQKEIIYGIELTIPIFNKLENRKDISNAKIDLIDARYSYELEKKKLYKQIQQSHADAVAAYNKYNAASEAVISNEEAFKYTEQKFNVGLVNAADYQVAKNELLKTKAELLISKYEYIFMVKILDFYTGKPFTL